MVAMSEPGGLQHVEDGCPHHAHDANKERDVLRNPALVPKASSNDFGGYCVKPCQGAILCTRFQRLIMSWGTSQALQEQLQEFSGDRKLCCGHICLNLAFSLC